MSQRALEVLVQAKEMDRGLEELAEAAAALDRAVSYFNSCHHVYAAARAREFEQDVRNLRNLTAAVPPQARP